MQDVCHWCLSKIKTPKNKKKGTIFFCYLRCFWLEKLFQRNYCDEEINRREHYAELTRGDDYG